ncbi:MAG: L-fucose/L-arabinose isomerase family protein [Actinobacteria bacterium]|nr:L-fucose/L-arabinose isomerase family protein [Actinomycetota bacterium]
MPANFKSLKFGFVNLTLDFLEAEDLEAAKKFATDAKNYLKNELKVEIVESAPSIDSREKANSAWKMFQSENVDGVIIFNGTFSTGEVTAEIVRNLDLPYLIWGLEEFAIKKHNFTGSMVGVLPQGTIFANLGKKFSFVYGNVSRPKVKDKVRIFVNAVRAISYLRGATVGVIGMRPDGFEISDFDELAIKKIFGTTITKVSMYAFTNTIKSVTDKEISEDMKIQKEIFDIPAENLKESEGLSKVYIAVKKMVQEKNLQAYAPDCWPELRDIDKTAICPANGRMTAEGVMASCECDVNGALSMLMEYAMIQTTPWLADLVNYLEDKDALLFWHCGNASFNLSDKKPLINRPFGGLAQTATLRPGRATVCRLNSIRGEYTLHVGTGEVIDNKEYIKGSNLTIKMDGGSMGFIESLLYNGIPHHNSIVYGDILEEVKEFGNLMNIPVTVF